MSDMITKFELGIRVEKILSINVADMSVALVGIMIQGNPLKDKVEDKKS